MSTPIAGRQGRSSSTGYVTDVVAPQRHHRKDNDNNLSPRGAVDAAMPWRHDMSLMIEDLARDRMREIQRDSERIRQIRRARQARRQAKAATSER